MLQYESFPLMLLVLPGGMVLGGFYFGVLWYTVQRLPTVARPALWMIFSFMLRLGVMLIGFYLLSSGHWQNLLLALLGFVMVRSVLMYRLKPKRKKFVSMPGNN